MAEIPKKNTLARFEQTSEAMPQLSAEILRPEIEQAKPESGQAEVRSIHVPKLDRQTVWRVIELLKSL